jgi:hypothetical protein
MNLIGTGEIERDHGLTRVQVFRLLKAGDWPKPYAELADGRKVWKPDTVARHIEKLKEVGRLTTDMRIVPWRYIDQGNSTRRVRLKRKLAASAA